ncbi:molybdate ABC transporter substrate-binding protein, partial [Nostoc sp. CHAB 5715]|uniref:molybdate ABC transporter substrate-binding protein n=1 Tax=Nostoc sp. CHAB 5715 TaxID=2780400 RepID=UPI001E56348F
AHRRSATAARQQAVPGRLRPAGPGHRPRPQGHRADLRPGHAGIAIGDYTGTPPVVPAGNYAKQVLTSRGIFTTVSPKLSLASNVRTVLTAVENKTLQVNGVNKTINAGFVYTTDAAISNKVRVVQTALTRESDPIVYPLGILTRTTVLTTARNFSNYLTGTTAQNIFKGYGFLAP